MKKIMAFLLVSLVMMNIHITGMKAEETEDKEQIVLESEIVLGG